MREEKIQRRGQTVICRSLHPNTNARLDQMVRETGATRSKIVAAILALYFGTLPPEPDEMNPINETGRAG